MKAVFYGRFSSDKQSEHSIDDQFTLCKRAANNLGYEITSRYEDHAISGASIHTRDGFQKLQRDLGNNDFQVIIIESIDRLGRNLADLAQFYNELTFNKKKLIAVNGGEITQMHIGMLGTMSEIFLSELKAKTKRGMIGNINAGKVPSGLAFGYDVAKDGDDVQGNRTINKVEAAIVIRIFEEYANGKSPRQITKELNAEGIPGPKGRNWKDTTIRGQIYRGTGILNQFLYIGINCWNMCSYVKDPRTGKRVARPNPEELWETSEVPELRIISDDLWNKVKARQKSVFKKMERDENGNALNRVHRKRFLLSGLLKCSECGGNYSVISKDRYGCSNHKRGSCSCTNSITIKRQVLEGRILSALKHKLIKPELIKAFVAEYTKALKEKFAKANESQDLLQAELKQIYSKIEGIMRAIEDGLYSSSMKTRLEGLEAEKEKLQNELDLTQQNAPEFELHPNIEDLYARQVQRLEEALNSECISTQAIELIQGMLEKIVLTPDNGADNNLAIDLYGDLAQILSVCHEAGGHKNQLPASIETGSQITVVAGARFELTTFRL